MPKKWCAHGLCKNNSHDFPQMKFAIFPKPRFGKERVKRWVELCGRAKDNFSVENVTYSYVCEQHFAREKRESVLNPELNYRLDPDLEPFPVGYVEREKRRRSPTPEQQPPPEIPDVAQMGTFEMAKCLRESNVYLFISKFAKYKKILIDLQLMIRNELKYAY